MVPIMVYMLRMPMHVVVGTSLFQILFTCIEVTFLQAYTNHSVDFLLAVLLLLGSTIGAQVGAVFGRKLKADQLKILARRDRARGDRQDHLRTDAYAVIAHFTGRRTLMKKFGLRIADWGIAMRAALAFIFILIFTSNASAMLTAKANHDHITIDFFYHGSTVSVRGESDPNVDLVIKITSPEGHQVLKQKGKVGGSFVDERGATQVRAHPEFLRCLSARRSLMRC